MANDDDILRQVTIPNQILEKFALTVRMTLNPEEKVFKSTTHANKQATASIRSFLAKFAKEGTTTKPFDTETEQGGVGGVAVENYRNADERKGDRGTFQTPETREPDTTPKPARRGGNSQYVEGDGEEENMEELWQVDFKIVYKPDDFKGFSFESLNKDIRKHTNGFFEVIINGKLEDGSTVNNPKTSARVVLDLVKHGVEKLTDGKILADTQQSFQGMMRRFIIHSFTSHSNHIPSIHNRIPRKSIRTSSRCCR